MGADKSKENVRPSMDYQHSEGPDTVVDAKQHVLGDLKNRKKQAADNQVEDW